MIRTWRGKLARVNYYFLEGNSALNQIKLVLYILAAFKILGVDLWLLIALSPFVYAAHVLAGWWWVRHGWVRELTEVPTTDGIAPVLQWQLYMQIRLYQHLGITLNGMDLTKMPDELRHVLQSFQKGRA